MNAANSMEAPADRPEVVPLKINAFEQIRQSNTQLQPLFPYTHPGSIIPCTAAFEGGGPGSHIGYFVHENSVDEVAIVLASNGQHRSGDTWCGPRKHGVGFDAPVPFFMAMVITQRQLEEGEQPEALTFQCEKCNAALLRHEFSGATLGEHQHFPPLPTTLGSFEAADIMRREPERLTCNECGHVSRPFPLHIWGWERYVRNNGTVEKAWSALEEAVR